jgi:hypothetical protein
MKLFEVFAKPQTKWTWVDANNRSRGRDEAHFTVGEREYFVAFQPDVGVNVHDDERDRIRATDIMFKMWRNPGGDTGTGITNTGDSVQVFSAVTNIIKEYIAKHHPDNIVFGAAEPSRVKLYKRLASRLQGYHTETWINENRDTVFLMTRHT